jgi:hypothetical protein
MSFSTKRVALGFGGVLMQIVDRLGAEGEAGGELGSKVIPQLFLEKLPFGFGPRWSRCSPTMGRWHAESHRFIADVATVGGTTNRYCI